MAHWGKAFFRKEIFDPGAPEALAQARHEAVFAFRALGLKKGQRVLDLCCGTGRHSFELARLGARVTGVDITPAYLADAKRRLGGPNDPVFVRSDMRRLSYRGEFDAAINLWTSFGYFDDPREDLKVLRGVFRALRPGGCFLIDVVDGAWLKTHAAPKNWFRRADGAYVLEEVVQRAGRDPGLTNTWTVVPPGGKPQRASFFVRQYDWPRLKAALESCALAVARRWGGLENASYRPGARRLVVLAKKPR